MNPLLLWKQFLMSCREESKFLLLPIPTEYRQFLSSSRESLLLMGITANETLKTSLHRTHVALGSYPASCCQYGSACCILGCIRMKNAHVNVFRAPTHRSSTSLLRGCGFRSYPTPIMYAEEAMAIIFVITSGEAPRHHLVGCCHIPGCKCCSCRSVSQNLTIN